MKNYTRIRLHIARPFFFFSLSSYYNKMHNEATTNNQISHPNEIELTTYLHTKYFLWLVPLLASIRRRTMTVKCDFSFLFFFSLLASGNCRQKHRPNDTIRNWNCAIWPVVCNYFSFARNALAARSMKFLFITFLYFSFVFFLVNRISL